MLMGILDLPGFVSEAGIDGLVSGSFFSVEMMGEIFVRLGTSFLNQDSYWPFKLQPIYNNSSKGISRQLWSKGDRPNLMVSHGSTNTADLPRSGKTGVYHVAFPAIHGHWQNVIQTLFLHSTCQFDSTWLLQQKCAK